MEDKSYKALLIEDNPLDAKLMQKLLAKSDGTVFEMKSAGTLTEGLNHLSASATDIIILDLNLPDSKGIDTYLKIKDHSPDLPVVVLTGMGDKKIVDRALCEGVQDYLQKGQINASLLERTIRYSIARKKFELDLRDANELLEQKVVERTRELEETIEKLSNEITERKNAEKALKKSQDELEMRIEERTREFKRANDQLNLQLEERQMMSEALHESEEQFRSLVANLPGAVYRFRIDDEWTLEFMSEMIEEITGFPPSYFIQNRVRPYRSIIHPDDREKVEKAVREGLDPMQSIFVEYRIIDSDGRIRWFLEKGQAIFSQEGQPLWLNGAIFDDSERKFAEEALQKANEALKRLAIIDGLTQISNRRRFDEFLANEWKRALRSKQNLSLILCDIDFFKLYNDNYGHQAGDQCLHTVAQAINNMLRRPADLAARYGGEEFVIILPDTDIEGAFHVSERIRSKIQQLEILHEHSTVEKHVTLSLGVASIVPTHVSLPESLLKKADKAMYEAKEKGRNQTVVFAK